jgi:hypothetical protein
LTALVRLDEHHQLAENPAEIPTVDLVDYEHVRESACLIALCAAAELMKDAVPQVERALCRRSEALNEVLVRVGLMELDHLDAIVVIETDQGLRHSASDVCLPNARRSLKNEILLHRSASRASSNCDSDKKRPSIAVCLV